MVTGFFLFLVTGTQTILKIPARLLIVSRNNSRDSEGCGLLCAHGKRSGILQ